VCWSFGAAGFELCSCCRLKHNIFALKLGQVLSSLVNLRFQIIYFLKSLPTKYMYVISLYQGLHQWSAVSLIWPGRFKWACIQHCVITANATKALMY